MAHRVLIVDDLVPLAESLRAELEDAGYECVIASSIAHARGELTRGRFEVALVDLQLGKEHGDELIPILRQSSAETTVILMSGADGDLLPEAAQRAGADIALRKPFDIGLLRAVLAVSRLSTSRTRFVTHRDCDPNEDTLEIAV